MLHFTQAAPELADWLQGWGTVAGAAFSALAFLATLGLLVHEIRVRRRDEQDRTAQQARLITTITRTDSKQETPLVFAEVTNHSVAPVFDIAVAPQEVRFRTKVGGGQYLTDLSVRDLHYLTDHVYLLDQLGPGQTHAFPSWGSEYGASSAGAAVRLPVTT
ncbi:MAG TPA: hypothetical protein VFO77_05180 [Actinoplanes sp.]|nr:hypothetical protein [Actinoplanes sp.]